jgi:hypothetical protein
MRKHGAIMSMQEPGMPMSDERSLRKKKKKKKRYDHKGTGVNEDCLPIFQTWCDNRNPGALQQMIMVFGYFTHPLSQLQARLERNGGR